jgi:tetratricopeptide (TPR) repeat protein
MGLEVDPDIWEAACEVLGVAPDWELVDHLLSAQLAMPGPTFRSWRFGHYLVADALVRRADFGGRAKAHHAAAAQVLKARGFADEAPLLGRHQVGAGQLEKALDTLLRGALGCIDRSAWNSAWALLQEREHALQALNIPQSDSRWAEGWLARAESIRARNDLEMCVGLCQKVLDVVEPGSEWAVKALMGQGRVARIRGDHKTARALLEKAEGQYSGPDIGRVPYLVQLGILEATYGDVAKARELYEAALLVARASGEGDVIQEVQFHMAGLFRRLGDGASAREALTEVRAWCAANGRRERVAQCANDLAEMDRLHGDGDAAIAGYRESLRLYEAVGARQAYVARTNLGIMAAERGHTVEAREHLDRVVPMLQRMKLRGIEGLAHLVLVLVETHDGQWAEWDARFKVGVGLLEETGFVDVDVARTFELIGEAALAAGEVQRARISLQLSEQHWEELERAEEAARVADLMAEIEAMS